MRKYILALIALLAMTGAANAAPSISNMTGTLTHGQEVTLTGSLFGTHPNYNEGFTWKGYTPLNAMFKDYEDSSLTSGGWAADRPAGLSIQTGGSPSGTKYKRAQYVDNEDIFDYFSMDKATGTLFSTFKFMMSANMQAGKYWRVYNTNYSQDIYLATGCGNTHVRGESAQCRSGDVEWGEGTAYTPGQWARTEVVAQNSPSGLVTTLLNGTQVLAHTGWSCVTWTRFVLPNMIDDISLWYRVEACPNATWGSFNYDDVFVDHTLARVELCTGETWANRGSCEPQIPTVWGTGSVKFLTNVGSLSTTGSKYLYAIDSNGGVSSPYGPVTIGGGGTPTPVDGVCGSSNGGSFNAPPTTGLCEDNSTPTVSGPTSGQYTWTCLGTNGGNSDSCSATYVPPATGSALQIRATAACSFK